MTRIFLLALLTACNSDAVVQTQPETQPETQSVTQEPEKEAEKLSEKRNIVEVPYPRISARHILVSYSDAKTAPEDITRSSTEAERIAEGLAADLATGADFDTLAREHSDGPSAARGGELGVFTSGVMNAKFEAATLALKPGERSAVVETPFGFHIIERMEVIEVNLAHVLIQWTGVKSSRSERTKEEARERAEQAIALLEAGQDFSEVARDWSDGPYGSRGGTIGWFQKGQMAPQFDKAAFALEIGEHSNIVESPHGFHIIVRLTETNP